MRSVISIDLWSNLHRKELWCSLMEDQPTVAFKSLRNTPSKKLLSFFKNPDKYVPYALNKAIEKVTEDIVIRIDAHTDYAGDYVEAIIKSFEKSGADIVGGPTGVRADEPFQKAVAEALCTTFGMGATKRVAELYCQYLEESGDHSTHFVTTRFGNVLGSNGSVIPLFTKQIQQGGPLTVTHKEITRYFMTIPEACSLVLEAGSMSKGGEIYVFDMGKAVKIYDLALKRIRLSGLRPHEDVEIKVTGLRPGEKLYEELLTKKEDTKPTHHPKIMITDKESIDVEKMNFLFKHLSDVTTTGDAQEIVRTMKWMVPEYISRNSEFCELDVTLWDA